LGSFTRGSDHGGEEERENAKGVRHKRGADIGKKVGKALHRNATATWDTGATQFRRRIQ
jgi:hypothetical protein